MRCPSRLDSGIGTDLTLTLAPDTLPPVLVLPSARLPVCLFTPTPAATPKMPIALGAAPEVDTPALARVDWKRDAGLRKLYFYCMVLCVASATTGYDGMFFNSVQNFETWKDFFGNPQGSQLGLLGALYQIGSLVSIPLVPYLADNYGRRLPIAIGCVIMIVGAAMQGSCKTLGVFMGGRALLGFGNSLAQISSPMLLTELCHPQHRGRLTTVYNCLWNVGALIVTWLSFGTDYLNSNASWRIPAAGQGLPSVIQLAFLWWVPESPRFLIAQDRHDAALDILAKYHGNGDTQHPTVQFEFTEIRETLRLEMASSANSSYLDFFKTKGNRYRLIVLLSLGIFSQWSGNAIISNYQSKLYDTAGVTNATVKLGLSGGQTGLSLIVSIGMAMLVDRVGRRPMFLAATGGMFGTFIFWTLTAGLYEEHSDKAPGANYAMIFFIWLFGIFYALAWSGLLVGYSMEILPYRLRAKGLMIMNYTVQAALTLNVYANPVAFEFFGDKQGASWKLYLIYTCWIGLELAFVWYMYVETRGPTLEELARVIDGPGAVPDHLDLGLADVDVKEKQEHVEEKSDKSDK